MHREKELWELRQDAIAYVRRIWGGEPVDFGGRSCEGIADQLLNMLGCSRVFVGEEYFLGALVW